MESLRYPWQREVSYETMEEYQEHLASVMNMNDEGEHVSMMDNLYSHTKNNEKIMELCTLAAEKMLMISDAEYGEIMLFSYDCFARFHVYLKWYFAKLTGEVLEEGMEQKAMENWEWLQGYFSGLKN
jgi:hypothetical protein